MERKPKNWSGSVLLFSSNWNNRSNTGVTNLNSNNVTSNSNRNIGTHLAQDRPKVYSEQFPDHAVRQNTILWRDSVSSFGEGSVSLLLIRVM